MIEKIKAWWRWFYGSKVLVRIGGIVCIHCAGPLTQNIRTGDVRCVPCRKPVDVIDLTSSWPAKRLRKEL